MDAHTATTTHFCKFPGCTNEVKSPVGRYSYCEEHRDRENRGLPAVAPGTREARPAKPAAKATPAPKGLAHALAALGRDARKLDAERARAAALTDKALAAKRAVDALQAEFDRRLRELSGPNGSA